MRRHGLLGRWKGLRGVEVAVICAALAVAALPAVASAATVSADRPCYVPGQPAHITGSGFTPNGDVSLSLAQDGSSEPAHSTLLVTADAAGNFDVRVETPELASRNDSQEQVFLAALDQQTSGPGGPGTTATTRWFNSIFDVFVPPWDSRKANPRKKTTFYAYGFQLADGKTLYAHYVRRGKLRKTVAIGRLKGPCGNLRKRMRQFPFRPVPAGTYKVKIDATKRFPNNSPGYRYTRVKVSRKLAVR